MKEIKLEVEKAVGEARAINVFLFDGAQRIGRYQVRINADGRSDVYYSDIEGKSFSKTRKIQKPTAGTAPKDPVAAAIERDLTEKGMAAPALKSMEFGL